MRPSHLVLFLALVLLPAWSPATANDTLASNVAPRSTVEHRDGTKRFTFDEVASAMAWRDKQCTTRQMVFDGNARVHAYDDGSPIPINEAFFVADIPGTTTIAAFADRQAASAFAAAHGGRLLDYATLVQRSF